MGADVEQLDIADFLQAHPPFSGIDRDEVAAIAADVSVTYFRRGSLLLEEGTHNALLYMLRSGSVDVMRGGVLSARLAAGGFFGYPSLLRDGITRSRVRALEDTLIYQLPQATFKRLCDAHHDVELFFARAEADRLQVAVSSARQSGTADARVFTDSISQILARPAPVSVAVGTSIQQAAQHMADQAVSTLLVMDDGRLAGILTDKDLRRRVVAVGLDVTARIETVMTPNPMTLTPDAQVFEALMAMTRHGFNHLPIVGDSGAPVGVISSRDILHGLSSSAVYLTARISKAADVAEISAITSELCGMMRTLVDAGAHADAVGKMVSSIGEAAHRRLSELAEAELGPAPVPYALVVFGSLARQDQTAISDQDNGFILDDSYDPQAHGPYFEKLATKLCDGLNQAGYVYCNGEIMATNPKWRTTVSGWQATFAQWIASPDPKSLMHTTIFFDLRCVHGTEELVTQVQRAALTGAGGNKIFLAALTGNALQSRVPLGFFRRFVLQHDEKQGDALDLKKQGTVPICDIARVHALAHGITAVGTSDRLMALSQVGHLAASDADELRDALAFIARVRLDHQARQIAAGDVPDNLVAPDSLSSFEREHLRDAFSVVRTHQEGLARAYAGGMV